MTMYPLLNFRVCVSKTTAGLSVAMHIVVVSSLLVSRPAQARDYFDPSFLGITGDNSTVDLSAFSEPGGIEEGSYTLSVQVNQQSQGQYTLDFKRNKQGKIRPLLTPAQLESFGVNVAMIPALKNLPADQPVDELSALIPQASATLNLEQLRLDISIPQIAMKAGLKNAVEPALWDEGISAIMASYMLSGGRNDNRSGGLNGYSNNMFALLRAGANTGPWRLRSTITQTWSETSVQSASVSSARSTRFSDTYVARGVIPLRSVMLAGESSTGSDVFDSIPFRGVKLSSNEQMLPAQLRGYAPVIDGVASSNARVSVRQNGNVVYETWVAPGPFRLTDIQQAGLSGNLEVTVSEADGSVRSFIVPYSSLPIMLRESGWKYELAAGKYDGNLTQSSRQADFLLGSLIYGLPRGFTLYGGSVMAKDYQALNIGSGISLGDYGALSTDVTASSARFIDAKETGKSYRLRYSKSLLSTGTSVDLTALRYSTRNYYSFSEFNSQGYRLEDGVSPWLSQRRRSSFQTRLSQQMGVWGSLNFRASRDEYWDGERSLTGLAAGYSNSWHGVSYTMNYSIDRMKNRDGNWPENRQLSLNISVPFSVFGYSQSLQSVYATTSLSRDNTGRMLSQTGISGSALNNRLSYSASQSLGNQSLAASSNLSAGWQGTMGSMSAGYAYSGNSRSASLNVSGGLLVHQDGVTLSRSLGEAVALVSAPGAAGVSVSSGTAVTDSRGYAVVPYLNAYGKNNVGLDPTTLPEGVDIRQSNINVYPTQGAIVKADFATRVGYQVLITLKQSAGVVPFGAIATLTGQAAGEENSSIVGDAGQVYMSGLPEKGALLVSWGNDKKHQCRAVFDLNKSKTTPDNPVRETIVNCELVAEKS